MSDKDYNFIRPAHSYGAGLGKRFNTLIKGGEEQLGVRSPPPNPLNSPWREEIKNIGPLSHVCLESVPAAIIASNLGRAFLQLIGTILLFAQLFGSQRSLNFNPLPK